MRHFYIIFILLPTLVFGQSSYLDSTSSWHERLTESGYPNPDMYTVKNYHYHFIGDTILNSKLYYKLFRTGADTTTNMYTNDVTVSYFNDTIGFIREDTLTSEFFFLSWGNPTNEEQLYDFTLDQGAVVVANGGVAGACQDLPILSSGTFNFNGSNRLKLDVGGASNSGPNKIFEGIGASSGLLGRMCVSFDGYSTCLLGFSSSTDTIEFGNCNSIITDVADHDMMELSVEMSPNPVQSTVQIKVGNDKINEFRYSVYSILGQVVLKSQTVGGRLETVDMTSLGSGTYVILITVDNATISRKVLKF